MDKPNYGVAKKSIEKIREANYDVSILTQSERDNLLALLDEFIGAQDWDIEELRLMARQHEN